jgi:hypothetical protein
MRNISTLNDLCGFAPNVPILIHAGICPNKTAELRPYEAEHHNSGNRSKIWTSLIRLGVRMPPNSAICRPHVRNGRKSISLNEVPAGTAHEVDWTGGYVTGVEYTHGYYRELSPTLLRLVCLVAGVAPPATEQLRYLELGYGQGLSINIHAAANSGEFWGTDFNPSQAGHAHTLAAASGTGVKLLDDSFAELAARSDLPEFDIIAIHGIWSWVSDENRRVITNLIRRKLRIGGLVYLSYNCFPGWTAAMPLRHLLKLHTDLAASESAGVVSKVEGALSFAFRVADSGGLYFRAHPSIMARLKKMVEQDRNYLAHEYFNRDWQPMNFSEVAQQLTGSRLSFVASAHPLDHVDGLNLTAEGRKLIGEIQHPILQQTVRDYLVNQQFRRDIFMKGPRRLSSADQLELLQSELFFLTTHPGDIPRKVGGALGEATMQEQIYGPLIEVMADGGYSPKKLGQLAAHPKLKSLGFAQLLQAMLVLVGAGHAFPAQSFAQSQHTACQALNRHLCEQGRNRADIGFLASPVLGAGVPVPRLHQLWLLALQDGKKTPADQATFVFDLLRSRQQHVMRDGKAIESRKEAIVELTDLARQFAAKRVDILKAAGINAI